VTTILMALVLGVYMVQVLAGGADNWTLVRLGANFVAASLSGEPWRLVAGTFLHGGWLHLVVNLYGLLVLGRFTERLYGPARLTVIYLLAGIAGSLASAVWGEPWRLSVGASGAIFGLLGAALMGMLRLRGLVPERQRKRVMLSLLFVTAINLAFGLSVPQVDNAAHVGGLAGGALVAFLLSGRPRRPGARWPQVAALAAAALALACGVLTAVTSVRQTLERIPQRTARLGPVEARCPVHWISVPLERGRALKDPLPAVPLTLQMEAGALEPGAELAREVQAVARKWADDLARQPGVSQVQLLERPLLDLAGSGVLVTPIRFRSRGLTLLHLHIFRQQGDQVAMALVRLPERRLDDYRQVLRRLAASLRIAGEAI
jgi:membrane associated rhomboid family serine protease